MSTLKRYNLLASWYQHDTRHQHVLHGVDASQHNNMLINKTNFAWSVIIDDLLNNDGFSEQQRNAKLRNWYSICCTRDYAAVICACKSAYDILIDNMSKNVVDLTYVDFKGLLTCTDLTYADVGQLLSPISTYIDACLTSETTTLNGVYQNNQARSLKVCSAFLSFPKKINFTEVGLEDKALSDYIQLEERNKSFSLNEDVIRDLEPIVYQWFKNYRYDISLVRHGTGSVADASNSKSAKYDSFRVDGKLNYLLKPSGYHVLDDEAHTVVNANFSNDNLDRTSKLVFVPKDVTKLRSISMEPASLQYLQQAAYRSIRRYMESTVVGNHINLADQGQNRTLAYDGSCTNMYSTLDLSSASDTVLWPLVKRLFRRCPAMLRVLYCTRSTHTVLPNGDKCELIKFAPMGSALCFPIESIIFAAIAKLAINRSKGNHRNGPKPFTTFFSVFGDDIILPQYAAEICSDLLYELGFLLNKQKSFISGPFKESCGGNYFCGYDITGLKFKPDFDESYKNSISPNAYDALIAYANEAYISGFKVFRCYCIHQLLDAGHKPVFGSDIHDNGKIFSPTPTNFHLKTKHNRALQREEVQATITEPIKVKNGDWELGMYSEWCLSRPSNPPGLWKMNKHGAYVLNDRHGEDHACHSSRNTRFRKRWVELTTMFSITGYSDSWKVED